MPGYVSFDAVLDMIEVAGLASEDRVALVQFLNDLGRVYFVHCTGCEYFREGKCGHPDHEVLPSVYPMDGCTKGKPKGYIEVGSV